MDSTFPIQQETPRPTYQIGAGLPHVHLPGESRIAREKTRFIFAFEYKINFSFPDRKKSQAKA